MVLLIAPVTSKPQTRLTMYDTRTKIFLLLDHKEYYGIDKTLADAENLIKNISSETLLNYIAGFGVNLFLNENSEDTGKIQFSLVNSLIGNCSTSVKMKWVSVVKKQEGNGQLPLMFWTYSNLLFYGLIFKNFNPRNSKDLTNKEALKVFDAYLIINGVANSKVQVESETLKEADENDKIEEIMLPSFIYQKDYVSTLDFSNQVSRGVNFFEYLENDSKYKAVIQEYYSLNKVDGFLKMFQNLMVIFSEVKIGPGLTKRNQLANLKTAYDEGFIDLDYIETLCINSEIPSYKEDINFGSLRRKFLYKISKYQFLILDINFLINQFYKSQIFSFNSYLKSKKIKADFLSEKGKNFSENIYLPIVLDTCFSDYVRFYGDSCKNFNDEELCDAYLREENKICLIEFKDVLLNASVKNGADQEDLFAEFDKKFVSNQSGKPKGITQLINAIKDIDLNSVLFDDSVPKDSIELYPVIVYTDFSFGSDGINKIFANKFRNKINQLKLQNVNVKELTFINLSFFEMHEDYFSSRLLNLFVMIDEYIVHISDTKNSLNPFEVFSRFYLNKYEMDDLGPVKSYLEHQKNIMQAGNRVDGSAP